MTIGHAIDELIELLRPMEHQMTALQQRALRTLSDKGTKLRERRQDMRLASLCPCKQHRRKQGSIVCWQCFAHAPKEMRDAPGKARTDDTQRQAIRALIDFAAARGKGSE